MKSTRLVYATAVFLLMLAGCSSSKNAAVATASAYKPTLDVTVSVNGESAAIHVDTDLKLSEEHYNKERKEGEGHIHISLDGGEKITVKKPDAVLEHLSKGKHNVKVSLHNNDHTPYNVSKSLDFVVE